MKPLTGKSALVTGGGSGVGLGTAKALAEAGATVTICGRNLEKLEAVAGDHLSTCKCDISKREEVDALILELGTPDILVNSAGVNIVKRKVSEIDPTDFDKLLAINCTGFFNLVHAALPAHCSRPGAHRAHRPHRYARRQSGGGAAR